jgi:hypothetical protein
MERMDQNVGFDRRESFDCVRGIAADDRLDSDSRHYGFLLDDHSNTTRG